MYISIVCRHMKANVPSMATMPIATHVLGSPLTIRCDRQHIAGHVCLLFQPESFRCTAVFVKDFKFWHLNGSSNTIIRSHKYGEHFDTCAVLTLRCPQVNSEPQSKLKDCLATCMSFIILALRSTAQSLRICS